MIEETVTADEVKNYASRTVLILSGAILLKLGFFIKTTGQLFGQSLNPVIIFMFYVLAFTVILSGVIGVKEKIIRYISWIIVGAIALGALGTYFTRTGAATIGTDGMLFSRYSVDLLLDGLNPYAQSMEPAFDKYNMNEQFSTFKKDGSRVNSLSYPALSVLLFLPQALLGIPNLNLTSVVFLFLVLIFLIRESPSWVAVAPFVILFADPSILFFTFGGVFDILWVLPFLLGMRYWTRGQYSYGTVFFGLAFAIKQTPWFIAPFLAIWLYHESPSVKEFKRNFVKSVSAGLLAFTLPNLPFIIWDFDSWVSSVMTPISGGVPLVKQGVGLGLITTTGVMQLPKSFYTLALLTFVGVLGVVYTLYFDRMKWIIWISPALILWWNYRSLQNYFVYFIPIAYYTVVLQWNQSSIEPPTTGWQPTRSLSDTQRRMILAGMVAGAALVLTASAPILSHETQLNIETEVDSSTNGDLGAIADMNVTVTNKENKAISPKFHLQNEKAQSHAYWDITSGPNTLNPGETATYTISAPNSKLLLASGTTTVLGINDAGTELDYRRVLHHRETTIDDSELLNSKFRYWSPTLKGQLREPYNWISVNSKRSGDTTIARAHSDETGATLEVSNVSRTEGPWAMAGLKQSRMIPDSITLSATPERVMKGTPKYPPYASGIQISDGNKRVWIVYSDTNTRKHITRVSGDLKYHIVYLPADVGVQTTSTVNLTKIYNNHSWTSPADRRTNGQATVETLAFTATYPNGPANNTIHIHSITTSSDNED